MFFSYDLLNPRHPVGQIWLAAHKKLKSRQDLLHAIQSLDDGIKNVMETKLVHNSREAQELGGGVPHSLRSASVLMYGCVVVYSKKIEFLKDESQHALTTIQQSSVAASVDLPPNAAGNASAVTLAPASEVDYDYLARLDRNAGAFRFNREDTPAAVNTLLQDPFDGAFATSQPVFEDDFYGMVEASSSMRSGRTPEQFRSRSQSAEPPERFRAAGAAEQPGNWNTDILQSPFAMPGINNDDDYGMPAAADYEHGQVTRDRLSTGQGLDARAFTPGSVGGDSLPGAPLADANAQDVTFKTPQSAKGKKKAKGSPAADAAQGTPGKGALKQKHKSPVGPKRRKIIADDPNYVVLKNREIRDMLQDPAPILREHEKLPGTAAEVLRQRLCLGERLLEVATRPVVASGLLEVPLAGVHPALQRFYRGRIGAAGAVAEAAEAAGEEGGAPASAEKKRKRASAEGAGAAAQEGDEWGGGAGPGPNDDFFEDFGPSPAGAGPDAAATGPSSAAPSSGRRRGAAAAEAEDEEGRVHFLDTLTDEFYRDQDEVQRQTPDMDDWSERTRSALLYLQRRFRKEGVLASGGKGKARADKGITLSSCISRENRLRAAAMLFELLVLQNKKFVQLDQTAPYGEVTIRPVATLAAGGGVEASA